ncbi:MAG TPA: YncE family protein [Candidatus Manganitrophaceae bacterium]|nr:YncE family protein [Candidatus Manganitrophaceae bacterium]
MNSSILSFFGFTAPKRERGILINLAIFLLAALGLFGGPVRAQTPSFQPMLLSFDSSQDRLFATSPSDDRKGTQLIVFSHPGRKGTGPGASLTFPGVLSGLFYHSGSKTLFASDATGHALLIFDRFDPLVTTRASRIVRRFNFPTGLYAAGGRLFIADAHPGALLVFEKAAEIDGTRRPDRTIGPEGSGLNGPFAIAADPDRGRLYVSNFDGVLDFNLSDLSAPPDRLPLPRGTLARGLAFDPRSKRLFIAAPMDRSYFVYDGAQLTRVRLQEAAGSFPFSISVDSEGNRLYLAGISREIGIIEQASGDLPEKKERVIDRWIRWDRAAPPEEEPAPAPNAPAVIRSPSQPEATGPADCAGFPAVRDAFCPASLP